MKKLILMALLIASPISFVGCGTPESIAYKSTAITVTTVDGAMNGWGDYVRAGKATDADQARVRSAYNKYRSALLIERDVIRTTAANPDATAVDLASQALAAASSDLIDLIQSIVKGTK